MKTGLKIVSSLLPGENRKENGQKFAAISAASVNRT
jgi:hypothetical protein